MGAGAGVNKCLLHRNRKHSNLTFNSQVVVLPMQSSWVTADLTSSSWCRERRTLEDTSGSAGAKLASYLKVCAINISPLTLVSSRAQACYREHSSKNPLLSALASLGNKGGKVWGRSVQGLLISKAGQLRDTRLENTDRQHGNKTLSALGS